MQRFSMIIFVDNKDVHHFIMDFIDYYKVCVCVCLCIENESSDGEKKKKNAFDDAIFRYSIIKYNLKLLL